MSKAEAEKVLTTIIQAGTLRTGIQALPFVDESVIDFGSHGLRTECVCPANIGLHKPVEIREGGFEHVPVDGGSYLFGVNLVRFEEYLKKADDHEPVELSFIPKERKLNIKYDGKDFNLACIDPKSIREVQDVPELDLPNKFTISAEDFEDAVWAADLVSDHLEIVCDPDADEKVVFRAEGDTDDAAVGLEDGEILDGKINERSSSLYSLEYLKKFKKSLPSNGKVEITIGTEFPVFLDYEFADGHGSSRTMIAPRITSD